MAERQIKIGQRVGLIGKDTNGVVAFTGLTNFSQGKWVGVILDDQVGKNNGTVQGKTYFQCEENYGLFVRSSQLVVLDEDLSFMDRTGSSLIATPDRPKSRLPLGSVSKPSGKPDKDEKESSPRQETRKSAAFVETGFVEDLAPQFSPGMTSSAIQLLEEKTNAQHNLQEMDNLRAEVKDLNEKLETLRVKRAEDKEKLKEGEKLRLQVEQLVEFKTRIMESQASLQRDLQKARQEAREAIEAKDLYVEESSELIENVELLTLDKEMAEEKAETLHLELEQARERIEDLTLDLELAKAEEGEADDGKSVIRDSLEMKQMQQQNARLHDTLIRMRDISAHDKHELQKHTKELEARKSEVAELSRVKEKLSIQLSELEGTIRDLQEQVDAALGAEEMVESLTERNLTLEERVSELLENVADLEAINDMNDQLQEDARGLELELREELDMAYGKMREHIREKEALNEVIVDQDSTIKKFRDLVQKQQEQNLDLRHALEKETNKPVGTPSEIIDFKKMFSETRAQGKAIDLEMRQLEVQQANQHVAYLTQYLPDTFIQRGGDHDAVLLLLLLPRLVAKCDILISGLRDKYSQPEVIDRNSVLKTHLVDQFSFASRMLQLLYMLQCYLRQHLHILTTCSVDVFLHMGKIWPLIAGHERNLDFYVNLLRKDQLDENVSPDHLERIMLYFEGIYPTHLNGQKLNQATYMSDVARVLLASTDATTTEAKRISALLLPSESCNEVSELFRSLASWSVEIGLCAKRIRRRMPQDGSTGPVGYPSEVQDALTECMTHAYNAMKTLRLIGQFSMQQTALIGDSDVSIPLSKMKELIHQATDYVFGSEDLGPESLRVSISTPLNHVSRIADSIEKGEFDFDGTVEKETVPPVTLRAETVKAELKNTEHLKYKLENREQDLKELKLSMKQKNEELSEMTVRRDMAEKKLSTAHRDADLTIEKLQRKLDDAIMLLRRKEKEFDETMDHLQHDIENLESEKGEMREKILALTKRTLFDGFPKTMRGSMSPSSPTAPSGLSSVGSSGMGGGSVGVKDSPLLLQQIADLKAALQQSNYSKNLQVAADMHNKLASLRPIMLQKSSLEATNGGEKRDLGKEEGEGEVGDVAVNVKQRVKQLTQITGRLRKELNYLLTDVSVVDLTKRCPGACPATQSIAPVQHVILHKNKCAKMHKQIVNIQDEVSSLVSERSPGAGINADFAVFTTPQVKKALNENDMLKVGQVRIPVTGIKAPDNVVPLVLQPEHLQRLHHRVLL